MMALKILTHTEWVGYDAQHELLFVEFAATLLADGVLRTEFGLCYDGSLLDSGALLHREADGCPWEAAEIAARECAAFVARCKASEHVAGTVSR